MIVVGAYRAELGERPESNPTSEGTLRKFLASAMSVALLVTIAGPSLASDEQNTTTDPDLHARSYDSLAQEQRTLNRSELAVERQRERERQRQRERERREERLAEIEAAEEAVAEEAAVADAAAAESTETTTETSASPELESIAQCESGGDYSANTGNGYYGAYQFTQETWEGVGGSGLPSEASAAEQDMRAQALMEQSGSSPWPVCGG